MSKIEVLSPAGSMDSLIAAVRCGADALYLGAKQFSARAKANNFSSEELIEAVSYCHKSNVKVYVTVNILIREEELPEVMQLIDFLNSIEVDALIVQDIGLISLIKQHYPQLEIHGSTQMSIHDKNALPILKQMGVKRIVTAREMNKYQLAEFTKAARELAIEVEHFVHGALCMSVSGQCQLSAMIGRRSGNRGMCAQPCRLPFSGSKTTDYDLSLKDQCLYANVKDMIEMQISSLKIEGRLKRSEYVAIATKCAREAVDNGKVDEELFKLLKDVFSRSGFTDGYFNNHLGKEMFGIRSLQDKEASKEVLNKVHQLYRWQYNNVDIDMTLADYQHDKVQLIVNDGKNTVIAYSESVELSNNKVNVDIIKSQLAKLGNTVYKLRECHVELTKDYYLPASLVNQLRREVIAKLDSIRSQIHYRERKQVKLSFENKNHSLNKLYIRVANLQQLEAIKIKPQGIIIPIELDCQNYMDNYIVEIPRYIKKSDYIEKRLAVLKEKGVKKAYCNNLSAIYLAQKYGMEVMAGNFMNITNSASCKVLSDLNINSITLSTELSFLEMERIKSKSDIGIISYGYLPLMLLVNCPLKNSRDCSKCDRKGYLVDRKNIKFPVRCHCDVSELLNSTPVYLADKKEDYSKFDYQIIYFTIESASEVERILNCYLGKDSGLQQYTRGLYYRGVI